LKNTENKIFIFRQGSAHRNNSLVVKHVSLAEGWDPHQVENFATLDDGGSRIDQKIKTFNHSSLLEPIRVEYVIPLSKHQC